MHEEPNGAGGASRRDIAHEITDRREPGLDGRHPSADMWHLQAAGE